MNKTTKSFSIIGLFVFSCIVYALNKEYPISDFLFDAKVIEKEEVDLVDDKTSTAFFNSTDTVLFSDDFEGTASKWTFTNDTTNKWHIGTATHNGGTSSMYISNDNGVTNEYTSNGNVSIAESTVFTIPTDAIELVFTYDWRSKAESTYDFGEVWLMPSTYVATNALITSANGGILIQNKLIDQATYKSDQIDIDITSFNSTSAKIVFVWKDDSSFQYQPPLSVDNISLTVPACPKVQSISINGISSNSITINWATLPSGMGIEFYHNTTGTPPAVTTTGTTVATGTTHTIPNLTPDTPYFIWYRSDCGINGKGEWYGPIQQATSCIAQPLPLDEGFNTDSTTLSCWTILDLNKDAQPLAKTNGWFINTSTVYEGDQAMYFYGSSTAKNHDDWLITPTYNLTAGSYYKLSYYYYSSTYSGDKNEFEVSLFNGGINPANPTQILVPRNQYKNGKYLLKEVYFQSQGGNTNIGWRVTNDGWTDLRIDMVRLEAVNCTDIENITLTDVTENSVSLDITDVGNTQWEYAVVAADAAPPAGAGTSTTSKSITISKDSNNLALVGDTDYDIYIRAKCGTSNNYNGWIGPVQFTTRCSPLALPFSEGFNSDSPTVKCWSIIDGNKDGGNNIWRLYNYSAYEGNQTAYFSGGTANHDDYLVSPTFNLVASKVYKLSYYYKGSSTEENKMEVVLSKTGTKAIDFQQVLQPIHNISNTNYEQKVLYITGITGPINIAWHVVGTNGNTIYVDLIKLEEVNCIDPQDIKLTSTTTSTANFTWNDEISTSWEYYVLPQGANAPTGAGTTVNTNSATVTKTNTNVNLTENTSYDFYVRAKCLDGTMGEWNGPISFKTLCDARTLPFEEGFNKDSTTFDCWTMIDVNKDATSATGNNLWRRIASSTYEGDNAMYFNGNNNIDHDDWMISPTFNFVQNGIYKLTYYYRTTTSYSNEFEVVLSNNGVALDQFTTVLVPKTTNNSTSYQKKEVYIQNIVGQVNIAWHVETSGYATIYIDKINLEKVDCIAPQSLKVDSTSTNTVDMSWTDSNSTEWEYWIQPRGGNAPTTGGLLANTNPFTASKDHAGNNLSPGTYYEYYVRGKCINGGYSSWEGPVTFFTLCSNYTVPYQETFNSVSDSADCWSVLDVNNDATSPTGSNLWRTTTSGTYEGDRAMYFYGAGNITHDDWLISPAITLTGKLYKISYQYKTSTSNNNDFDLVMSTNGTDFTNGTTLVSKKSINTSTYNEEVIFIKNISGDVRFGFHVVALNASTVYIDNFNIEEVDCTDPTNINISNIASNSVTLNFTDTINQEWEYVVQEVGYPIPNGNGTVLNSTSSAITHETITNTPLQPQTEYEIYIRSVCSPNEYGAWVGPIIFKTSCAIQALPFNENFETNSNTVDCWMMNDNNKDATSPTGSNLWRINSSGGVTGRAAYFSGTTKQHDDWLISPTFTFNANTMYQLTYKYRTSNSTSYENKFAVKISTTGTDISQFTQVILPSASYNNTSYVTEVVYIQGVTGSVNIAWHVDASKSNQLYIDDVSIKAVGCMSVKQEDITISNITFNNALVNWVDNSTSNLSYNYFVQLAGGTTPTGGGNSTTNKNITVTTLNSAGGGQLQPDTEYEVYIRSNCGPSKFGEWTGPIKFRTKCAPYNTPFWEGFNSDSTSINCWIKADNNGVYSPLTTSGRWSVYQTSYSYEGNRCVEFYASSANDWLISPSITTVATKYYRLKYHYRAYGSIGNIEVAYSTTGPIINGLTNTLVPKKNLTDNIYREENVVFKGVNGTVNIGWKVEASPTQDVLIDNIFIEEVEGCPEPTDLGVQNELPHSATITWDQKHEGSEWEYYVQKSGGNAPTKQTIGQAKVKTKQANADKDEKGDPLKNNTEYEFYVRTVCSATTNSIWAGPFKFMTACGVFNVPFDEGFNEGSVSLRCWSIVDSDGDATTTSMNMWRTTKTTKYEGSQAMEFSGGPDKQHDDWLISPTLKLDGTKVYRLKYYYRTTGYLDDSNEFELLLSTTGTATANFNKVIKAKQIYENTTEWKQEYRFISGYDGEVNIAWHVVSNGSADIFIDQFSIEEVENCPEPLDLDATNITHNSADLSWTDEFGATKFEYFVQEAGKRVPRLNDRGTPLLGTSVTINKDNRTRTTLLPNTDYEYYVRTLCNDSTYSIWAGPFKFTTPCGVYQTPFEEGFNSDSKSVRCWTILDPSNNATTAGANIWKTNTTTTPYEGDSSAIFGGNAGKLHDAWLITPDVELDGSLYVLKYRYKTTTNNNNEFEVLLSTTGTDTISFSTTLVAKSIYKVGSYVEEIVFFNGTQATTNIAWHVTSNGITNVQIDKVELKKVSTCPEPSHIKMDTNTSTSMQVSWQENGSAIAWEVIVVPYGKDITATPIQTVVVNNTPTATINNLSSSQMYSIYVRSICLNGTDKSDWSSEGKGYTKVGANDECVGAINVIPNLNAEDCNNIYHGVTDGATKTTAVLPQCWPGTPRESIDDQWFEFTATQIIHTIKVNNLVNLTTGNSETATFYIAVYDVNCGAIAAPSKWCSSISTNSRVGMTMTPMIPGQKYLVRIGYKPTGANRHSFDLCIGSHNGKYLEVTPSQPAEPGDPDDPNFTPDPKKPYTVDKLVKNVLVNSNCKLVSNVRYQNGDGSASTMAYNTIGYFNKGQTDFPFEEGIVLSTNEVQYVPGPAQPSSFDYRGGNEHRWVGDKDIRDLINDAGGAPRNDARITQLEFDFVPIKEVLQFEYLFASNSYSNDCTNVGCQAGALFGAWLIDTETGKGTNLAKINGTDTPIALNTILNNDWANKTYPSRCPNSYQELYWRHYDNVINNRLTSNIDFVGLTKPMQSDEFFVVPGRKYHIKLAVLDFCTTAEHTSAAFFKAGSFDLGDLDLGADLTVDNNNAICSTDSKTIETGLGTNNVDIKWFKDDVEIIGETKPNLVVTESGKYRVEAFYKDIQCPVKGEIEAEIYPAISKIVAKAEDISMCRYSLGEQELNLQAILDQMFEGVDKTPYTTQTYKTLDDLEYSTNEIKELLAYKITPNDQDEVIYFRIEDVRTGCMEIFPLTIKLEEGEKPEKPEDVIICDSYTLPSLPANQHYYTAAGAQGQEYKSGDVLEAGKYEIFVLQDNGKGCYEETSFVVEVTAKTPIQHLEDITLECQLFELPDLKDGSIYQLEIDGKRLEVPTGTLITRTNTKVYIVMESENGVCYEETSFMVRYNDCPIPKGISPNGDGFNDRFDLTKHGVTSIKIFNRNGSEVYSFQGLYTDQWDGKGKNNQYLPSGTYYYVIQSFDKTRTGWVEVIK